MCLLSCSLNTTLCAPHALKEEEARGQKPRPHRRVLVVVSSKGRIKESLLFLSSQKRLYEGTEEKKQRAQKQRSLRSGLIEKRI